MQSTTKKPQIRPLSRLHPSNSWLLPEQRQDLDILHKYKKRWFGKRLVKQKNIEANQPIRQRQARPII
ncbi:hypothetical protein T10_2463 [Trichinella papuae]|uniref:Uncharacterized protein n=1 Tax=Trichinella papuae TaxID=268474 RepID=A0A0V1N7Z5_9BILA|nr:hypothetical protein T10_2463 [Trichinella papuae]